MYISNQKIADLAKKHRLGVNDVLTILHGTRKTLTNKEIDESILEDIIKIALRNGYYSRLPQNLDWPKESSSNKIEGGGGIDSTAAGLFK